MASIAEVIAKNTSGGFVGSLALFSRARDFAFSDNSNYNASIITIIKESCSKNWSIEIQNRQLGHLFRQSLANPLGY